MKKGFISIGALATAITPLAVMSCSLKPHYDETAAFEINGGHLIKTKSDLLFHDFKSWLGDKIEGLPVWRKYKITCTINNIHNGKKNYIYFFHEILGQTVPMDHYINDDELKEMYDFIFT